MLNCSSELTIHLPCDQSGVSRLSLVLSNGSFVMHCLILKSTTEKRALFEMTSFGFCNSYVALLKPDECLLRLCIFLFEFMPFLALFLLAELLFCGEYGNSSMYSKRNHLTLVLTQVKSIYVMLHWTMVALMSGILFTPAMVLIESQTRLFPGVCTFIAISFQHDALTCVLCNSINIIYYLLGFWSYR